MLQKELAKMGYAFERIEPIRSKDGVHVARVFSGNGTAVLKYFEKAEYAREVENYSILKGLGVQTLDVIAATERAILLEDVSASPVLRLGIESDHADPIIAEKLAGWYRILHEKGRAYIAAHGENMYDETDCITEENLSLVREKTGTAGLPVWKEVDLCLGELILAAGKLPRTLTYNDFYYTNLIAARDKSFAFMYDYNLLGKGFVYSDVRNVTSSLQGKAVDAFLSAYGPTDPREEAADAVLSPLVTLIMACRRPVFPKWAGPSLAEMEHGFTEKLHRFLENS